MKRAYRIIKQDGAYMVAEGVEDIDGELLYFTQSPADLIADSEEDMREMIMDIAEQTQKSDVYKKNKLVYDEEDDTYLIDDEDDERTPLDEIFKD